jgi:uncharacterized protein (DUF1499 family)
MFEPCKAKANCVSSLNHEKRYQIDPLRYNRLKAAKNKLRDALRSIKRVRIVSDHGNYIRAECKSLIFRFIDDVEFYFDDNEKLIHVKSASRIGYSDFGVNRRRVEKIRKNFLKEANMSSKKSNIYIRSKSEVGLEILCPIDDVIDPNTTIMEDNEECVEQDVVGRYAGNIEIQ